MPPKKRNPPPAGPRRGDKKASAPESPLSKYKKEEASASASASQPSRSSHNNSEREQKAMAGRLRRSGATAVPAKAAAPPPPPPKQKKEKKKKTTKLQPPADLPPPDTLPPLAGGASKRSKKRAHEEDGEPAAAKRQQKEKKETQKQAQPPRAPEEQLVSDTDEERDFPHARPAYVAHTYAYVQDKLRELIGQQSVGDDGDEEVPPKAPGLIRAFAQKHFAFEGPRSDDAELLEGLQQGMDRHAALLVGCVADGGPKGVKGWLEIFRDPLQRQALVCAVVGKVLEEHVFASFSRAALRSAAIAAIIRDAANTAPFGLPPNFIPAAKLLTWQLHSILEPLRTLSAATTPKAVRGLTQLVRVRELYRIVVRAGVLSLHMGLDPHTVYFAVSAGKDDYWNEEEMRAFNRGEMVRTNPTRGGAEGWDGTEEGRERMQKAQYQLALVRMTIFPGWKAFKKGGWGRGDKERGLRVCELSRQWVSLRWGEQRTWEARPKGVEDEEEEQAKGKKGKKGKGKAKAKADVDVDEDKPRWEEWMMIWAQGQKDPKKALADVRNWFSFSIPGDELESEGEAIDDDVEAEMLSESESDL
ncbi:hypothetical protein UCDDS831_g06009 [Diplodia seriata]|uniref:Uncharacterized protein n=1 Tax=Diplodia seriata TaxID=420778 RepID=A0A0G2G2X0_9PEZI|nr:hypothetical protein UCDDS831_g06009 [Diplodia seriata]